MNKQKVALITGANRGIGFETAKQLGEQGIVVVLGARRLSAAREAAAHLTAQGLTAHGIQLDVTSPADRTAAAAFLTEHFGKLDILVNNAAVGPNLLVRKNLETTEEELQSAFSTNVFGVVHLTRALMPLLRKSPAGRIVNLSSTLGSLSIHAQENSPFATIGTLAYDASKAALNMFTIHLATELAGTAIKVNSAHPGWVKTEIGAYDAAPTEIPEGARTSVDLALLGEDGPTGKFIHLGEEMPW